MELKVKYQANNEEFEFIIDLDDTLDDGEWDNMDDYEKEDFIYSEIETDFMERSDVMLLEYDEK